MNYKKNIYLFILSAFMGIISFAMIIPVNIIQLHNLGHSASLIGLFSAIPPLMIFIVSPFLPWFQKRFGRKNLLVGCKLLIAIAPLGFLITDNFIFWCFINFFIGIFAAILWPFTDSYIAEYSPHEIKGKLTGIYQTLIGLSYTIGPAIPAYFKLPHAVSISIVVALSIISVIPTLFMKFEKHEDHHEEQERSYMHVLLTVSSLVIMAILGGMYEVGTVSMGTVHAINLGIASMDAGYISAAIGFGSFLCQYPLGLIADKFPVDRIIKICVLLLFASSIALFFTFGFYPLVLLAMVWGALGGAVYTLIMIKISKQYKGTQVRILTGMMISFYTLGYMIAPAISGVMIDASPIRGLPIFLTVICGICMFGIFTLKDRVSE